MTRYMISIVVVSSGKVLLPSTYLIGVKEYTTIF